MPKLKSETTDLERANYIEAALDMDHLLGNAISMLTTRRNAIADAVETLAINVQIPSLVAQQATIRAELAAFLADATAINPLTQEQVEVIKGRSEGLDAMIANAQNANSILVLVTAAANEWNNSRSA